MSNYEQIGQVPIYAWRVVPPAGPITLTVRGVDRTISVTGSLWGYGAKLESTPFEGVFPEDNTVAGALGAASSISPPSAGGMTPAPPPSPSGQLSSGPTETGQTIYIDARSGVVSNPIETAEDMRRMRRAGARAGVRQ